MAQMSCIAKHPHWILTVTKKTVKPFVAAVHHFFTIKFTATNLLLQ